MRAAFSATAAGCVGPTELHVENTLEIVWAESNICSSEGEGRRKGIGPDLSLLRESAGPMLGELAGTGCGPRKRLIKISEVRLEGAWSNSVVAPPASWMRIDTEI